jgi:hypothetical protein
MVLSMHLRLAANRRLKRMDKRRAIEILDRLSDGVNPITGEVFDKDGPYNDPDIIRALCFAVRQLGTLDSKPTAARGTRTGERWTADEDARLLAAWDAGEKIGGIALSHSRTSGAITSRLIRHGRIDGPGDDKFGQLGPEIRP